MLFLVAPIICVYTQTDRHVCMYILIYVCVYMLMHIYA